MAPPANDPEPQRSYPHKFERRRKRQRVPSLGNALESPQKRPRTPLGELDNAATNKIRHSVRKSGKSACEEFEHAIQPLAGVPEWLLEDCLKPMEEAGLQTAEDDVEEFHPAGTSSNITTLGDVTRDVTPVDDQVSSENGPEVDSDGLSLGHEDTANIPTDENEDGDLATRLQALPAHTLRSLIYDIAVTDRTGDLEAKLTDADKNKDVPSAVFGYQYCSVNSVVSMLDPEANQSQPPGHNEVEYAGHMIAELLLDIAGETFTISPYSTKRAALVAILKIFDVVFGFGGEGNQVAREIPADVEMAWAGLFEEVFWTLTTFEKQRLATASNGVFLEKLDSTISSIARAGLGCAGRQQGVLAELTKASVNLSQQGESVRRLEEFERAVMTGDIK